MLKPRVLVIEDDQVLSETLCDLLSDDYDALCVLTLAAGIAALSDVGLACILLDFNLPDGTGEHLLIRLTTEGRTVPVVLVSAAQAAPAVARRFGIELVAKPFDFDALLSAVATAISSSIIPMDATG